MNDTFFPRKQTVEIVSKTKPARAENGMQAFFFLGKLNYQGVLCNELTPVILRQVDLETQQQHLIKCWEAS